MGNARDGGASDGCVAGGAGVLVSLVHDYFAFPEGRRESLVWQAVVIRLP
jgi:hypothetical protein